MEEQKNNYYVYVLRRSDKIYNDGNFQPFYVGKGHGDRIFDHATVKAVNPHKENIINKLQREGKEVIYEKLMENLTELESFEVERQYIAFWGRENNGTGILTNLTSGGEGASGVIISVETRQRISDAVSGEKNGFYGKHHTEESKQKMSVGRMGCTHTEEFKIKSSESRKGELGPFYGKHHTEENKKHLSEIAKLRKGKVNKISVEVRGKVYSLSGVSREFNIPLRTTYNRYHQGLRGEKLLTGEVKELQIVSKEQQNEIPSVGVLPVSGRVCTKKTEKLLKVKKPRKRMSEESKQHLSNIWIGIPKSEEHGKKISAGKTKIIVEIDGVTKPLKEWAELYNIQYATMGYRWRRGLRGKDLIEQGRSKRDVSEYLDRDELGRLVSKKGNV